MTIQQTVEVPASHRLTIDVPRDIPAGRTILAFTPKPRDAAPDVPAKFESSVAASSVAASSVAEDGLDYEGECPLCAIYKEPNEETIAAIEEGEAMMRGEIPAIEFDSAEVFLIAP